MNGTLNVGLIGSLITLAIFLAGVIFRMGQQSARIDELEKWRSTIRIDMHEISDNLGAVGLELRRLATLIEERTQRHRDEDHRRPTDRD